MQDREHARDVIDKETYYRMVFVPDVTMFCMEENLKGKLKGKKIV